MVLKLVPATQKYVEEFYGGRPPMSLRGVVGLLDGKAVAIGGVFIDQRYVVVFSEMKEEARPYKKSILKIAFMVYENIITKYDVVYAVANPDEPGSKGLMARFGFQFVEINTKGEEVYRWLK